VAIHSHTERVRAPYEQTHADMWEAVSILRYEMRSPLWRVISEVVHEADAYARLDRALAQKVWR
jgi:hypothetical protein